MAVIVNRNTTQTPIASGQTGAQVIKFIDAPRVYIKAVDSSPTPVILKSNGSTPAGYTDLGIVNGKLKITYTKEQKEIRTGIDQVLRATYSGKKSATFEFVLSQFDDVVMTALSGLTASVLTAGSILQFAVGGEDVIQKAILLVTQNKIDGKEWQFYSPNAFVSFGIEDSGEETVIKGTGNLPAFTYNSSDILMTQSVFA